MDKTKLSRFIIKQWEKNNLITLLLLPFAFFYGFLQRLRRFFYGIGLFPGYRSSATVISVGNITVGGSGKTPFTIFLAKFLQENGLSVVVSHRGYKGEYENTIKLISQNKEQKLMAKYAGDEAQVLLRNLPQTPIIIGKNRKEAVKLAEKKFKPDFIILDDSFQHLKLEHDYDFLLFKADDPLGNGAVLPAGRLREPISSLAYADFFVFNNAGELNKIPAKIAKFSKPIIYSSYKISHFINYKFKMKVFAQALQNKRIFLLSAIGNPKSFENSIKELGINFISHFAFIDHYSFADKEELERVLAGASKQNIDYIITTEKDYVKLRNKLQDKEKFIYAKLEMTIEKQALLKNLLIREEL